MYHVYFDHNMNGWTVVKGQDAPVLSCRSYERRSLASTMVDLLNNCPFASELAMHEMCSRMLAA